MAYKIVSGGGPGFSETTKPAQEPEQQEEGWIPWGVRNVLKAPGIGYATLRSGMGLGDVEQEIQENLLGIPRGTFKYEMPTYEEALKSYEQGVSGPLGEKAGKYLTESRPEDYWAELATQILPAVAMTGGFSSMPALLKTLGVLGTSEVGGRLGESALEPYGFPKTGRFGGSLIGGHYGQKGIEVAKQMSSKVLGPKVEAHEQNLLDQKKSAEKEILNKEEVKAREEYQGQKTAYEKGEEERVKREHEEVQRLYAPILKFAFDEEKTAAEQLPKEQEAFRLDKEKRIGESRNKLVKFDKRAETLKKKQKESYTAAKKARNGGEIGDPTAIMERANEQALVGGLNAADEAALTKALSDINKGVINDTMTLDKAIELQKNFNGQLKGAHPNFIRAMHPLIAELNKFIKDVGGEEHYKHWSKAEALTGELADSYSKKARQALDHAINEEVRNIHGEKFSETRQNFLETQAKEAKQNRIIKEREYKQALNAIGVKTWNELMTDTNKQNKLEQAFVDAATEKIKEGFEKEVFEKTEQPSAGKYDAWIKFGLGSVGAVLGLLGLGKVGGVLGGLGGWLGKKAFNEIQFANKVFKKYPSMKAEAYTLIKDATRLTPKRLAVRLSMVGKHMEALSKTMKEDEPTTTGRKYKIIS
jgi:hypothetical protein